MDNIPPPSPRENLDAEDDYDLAPEDEAALSCLEDPARIRAWCRSRTKEYAARTRALSSVYNAALSVNRLPPEVLTMAFSYLPVSRKTFVRYLLVCRLWMKIISRAHTFWVNLLRNPITFLKEVDVARYASVLSRTGTLDLSLDTARYWRILAPCLIGHAYRIVCWRIHIYSLEDVVSFSGFLAGVELPKLEELTVSGAYLNSFAERRDELHREREREVPSYLFSHPLDSHSFSRLRSLSVPWQVFAPSNTLDALEDLRLSTSYGRQRLSGVTATHNFRTLLLAISRCPNLVRLHVEDHLTHIGDEPTSEVVMNVVQLPRLTRLSIDIGHDWFSSNLLSSLRYPLSTRIYLNRSEAKRMGSSWLPTDPDRFPAFYAVKAAVLYSSPHYNLSSITTFSDDSDDPMLHVSLEGLARWRVGGKKPDAMYSTVEVTNFIASSSITSLTVCDLDFHKADWKVVLEGLPHLVELGSKGKDDEETLLPLLLSGALTAYASNEPDEDHEGNGRLFAQHLQSLGFFWRYHEVNRELNAHDLTPALADDPEAIKVRNWRHELQKAFLSSRALPKEEQMVTLDQLFSTIENYPNMTFEYLMFSKIGKVMRHISVLPIEKVPRDDEFKFQERAKVLIDKWGIIAQMANVRCGLAILSDKLAAVISMRARPDAPFRRLSLLIPPGDQKPAAEVETYLRKRLEGLVEVVEVADQLHAWPRLKTVLSESP